MFTVTRQQPSTSFLPSSTLPSSSSSTKHHYGTANLDAMDLDMDVELDFNEYQYESQGHGQGQGQEEGLAGVVSPGEVITSSKEYMRGHGTYVEDEQVVSSVTGIIQRVNKLISVKPLNSRYTPEVGDLVIGRIVEVGPQRWKVETNARQDAVLMLSSVNLPGGVQRRKIESDALKMRDFLAEGDLLVAEVQAFFADGAMSLHTRSLKYGKLRNGHLLILPPRLIRRLKSHFHHLPPPCGPTGVDIILGLNGYVWISMGTDLEKREMGEGFDAEGVYSDKNDEITPEGRKAISLVADIINTFATYDIPLTDTLILEGYTFLSSHSYTNGPISPRIAREMIGEVTGVDIALQA